MQIILLERVEKLGQMGDVVEVKSGYGRNFLLPQGKAIRATKANIEAFKDRKHHLEAENLESRKEAEDVGAKLNGQEVVLIRQASEGGQLYGSVSARDIAEAVVKVGFQVNRTQVKLDRPIKTIGIFEYKLRLHPEVTVTVVVNVAQSLEEATGQSERRAKGEDVVVTLAAIQAREEAEESKIQAKVFADAARAAEAALDHNN